MCFFIVWKNACLKYREFDLEGDLVGTTYMVFICPVLRYTTKTCLKWVGNGGYEWVEKEMCRFTEDMRFQTHSKTFNLLYV